MGLYDPGQIRWTGAWWRARSLRSRFDTGCLQHGPHHRLLTREPAFAHKNPPASWPGGFSQVNNSRRCYCLTGTCSVYSRNAAAFDGAADLAVLDALHAGAAVAFVLEDIAAGHGIALEVVARLDAASARLLLDGGGLVLGRVAAVIAALGGPCARRASCGGDGAWPFPRRGRRRRAIRPGAGLGGGQAGHAQDGSANTQLQGTDPWILHSFTPFLVKSQGPSMRVSSSPFIGTARLRMQSMAYMLPRNAQAVADLGQAWVANQR